MTYQNKIVLLIDDDEEDRELVKEVLHRHDASIHVREVDNGKTALSFLEQAKHFNDLPSLIVLDLNMPVMDGKEFLVHFEKDEALHKIPVIIFTTSGSLLDKLFAKKHNVKLITKPPLFKEFSSAVKEMISYSL